MFLDCKYIIECSGCQIAHLEKSKQIDLKKNNFIELWNNSFQDIPEITFVRPTESKFRDRIDLTIENLSAESVSTSQKIGFYEKDSKNILDIESCPLMSDRASEFYSIIRRIKFPIQKGSLRIRVSPSGKKGIWLDFSNEDIKKLLDEKTTLNELSKICDVIEIGQKRKKLSKINEQYKLTDPETDTWFETYDKDLNPIPLNMNVGSFSQTGFTTNKILISELIKILKKITSKSWLELCSGSGNLTFPLLSLFPKVIATELDENAINSLKESARKLNLSDHLQTERINIHKPSKKLEELLSGVDGILADPPRSGLQGFLEVISKVPKENLPATFIYASCFAESLISDLKVLKELGYNVSKIIGVDQFPHSSHCEWIVELSQNN